MESDNQTDPVHCDSSLVEATTKSYPETSIATYWSTIHSKGEDTSTKAVVRRKARRSLSQCSSTAESYRRLEIRVRVQTDTQMLEVRQWGQQL